MNLKKALNDARDLYARSNPKSEAAHKAAAQYLPGGNTRSVLYVAPFPLTFAGGKGAHLTDIDGHEYIDFLSEFTAGLFGHSDSVLISAIVDAASHGMSLGGHNMWEARLAQALCERFPALELVRFTNSGTEANLFALAASRAFTKKDGIVVFRGGYHGGLLTFAKPDNIVNVPHEYIIAEYNDLEATRALIEQNHLRIGSVIIEPMMSSAGCIPADEEFLFMLREVTAKHEITLIFDEIVTSRLAPHGIHGKLGIRPDIVTLGKYIGGGLNIGAFGGRQDIMKLFDPRDASSLPHAGTFNNNVLTMQAGYAAMTQVYTAKVSYDLNERGDHFRDRLNAVAAETKLPLVFTGVGAVTNLHMVHGTVKSPADLVHNNLELRDLYYFHLLNRGIYLARRGMVNLSLPMTEADLDRVVEATREFTDIYGSVPASVVQTESLAL